MSDVRFLSAFSRGLLAALSIACFAAAVCFTPTEVRSQLATVPAIRASATPIPATLAVISPLRDPFQPTVDDRVLATPDARTIHDSLPALPALGPLPPNDGAGQFPTDPARPVPASGARLSAVAIGPHPSAIIEQNSASMIVTVGTKIGNARITSIDASAVHLSSGSVLLLASPAPASQE